MVNQESLPIDIQCNKLLDWLISRRHCNKDWEKGVMDIRRRIGEAVQDMPEDEKVVDLLKGQYIHYFQCLKIIEILKETEKDSKNFLGFYSSQRMNDWLQICQMYEKDNIGLAEASQMLIRLVHYKIPDLKRRIQKCDQNLIICELKEKDYNKLAEEARRQYEKDLQKMGIKGKNINYEISELVMDLPKFFNEIAQEIYSLKDAIDYYDDFSRYLHEQEPKSVALPVNKTLIKKGNDLAVFDLKYEVKSRSIEKTSLLPTTNADVSNEAEKIDFGDLDKDSNDAKNTEVGVGIKIVGDESGNSFNGTMCDARETFELFESPETRKLIFDELKELEKFLLFRQIDETTENFADIYISGLENRPFCLTKVAISQINSWLHQVQNLLRKLTDPQKSLLYKIRSSQHHLKMIAESFEHKFSLEERYKNLAQLTVSNQVGIRNARNILEAELNTMVESTRFLQKEIEKEISQKYNGRRVNIMGSVTAALSSV